MRIAETGQCRGYPLLQYYKEIGTGFFRSGKKTGVHQSTRLIPVSDSVLKSVLRLTEWVSSCVRRRVRSSIFIASESLFAIRSHRKCTTSKSLLGFWVESTSTQGRQVEISKNSALVPNSSFLLSRVRTASAEMPMHWAGRVTGKAGSSTDNNEACLHSYQRNPPPHSTHHPPLRAAITATAATALN